jgi:uncharacterized membrane protein (DUF485 family)
MNEQPRGNLHLLDDPEFKDLVARKNRISLILTVFTLIVYYGFIGLIAFNRDLFGARFTGKITLGIPIGVGVILFSWLFTGIYVRWANSKYDAMVENIRRKAGHGGP